MSFIPTKQITRLMKKAKESDGIYVKDGNYEMRYGWDSIVLTHYGTTILWYSPHDNLISISGAYSVSDRDAINSVCRLLGKPRCAYIERGVLKFDDDKFFER